MAALHEKFTLLENFGHSLKAPAYLFQPQSAEEIHDVFKLAKQTGLTVALRGAGKSYNDAALNGGGLVLDLRRMDCILAWDPGSGSITAEPGATLRQLWQAVLPDGWWPPVVSGTMTTTLGGCLGMNIHGKNNFRMGTIGEHVTQFIALLPTGAEVTCSPKKNGDLFRAMIGGLGMLGVFTSITLQMKRVHSGLLNVRAWNVPDLATHLREIETSAPEHNYTVGWLDCTARGKGLGRGQLHTADYLAEGGDPDSARTLRVDYQTLPDKFFGLVPKSLLHYFMAPFMNNLGTPAVNTAKYILGARAKTYRQPHAAFHFLLDYVPDWELAYGQLIQHQSFVPKETALAAWTGILSLSHKRSLPAYLGVTKRHRPDNFLLTHAVDGFSLALDFKVTAANRTGLSRMLQDFDRIVLDAGGRFYFAKNSETSAESARRFLGEETVAKFHALKKRCDPNRLLESDLYRRVFGDGR
jgi:decaprenylphospho-beta-D-ribofuranose 2-oxidase